MQNRTRRQLVLLSMSAVMAAILISVGVTYWWVWAVWGLVVFSQISVALGWPETLEPKPYVPPYAERKAIRLRFAEMDAEHEAKVQAWLAQQRDQEQ